MKRRFRSRWFWVALLLAMMPVGGILLLRQSVVNVMHPALDTLSAINLSERWSHPELLRIRAFGKKAVPSLRLVFIDKDSPTTRFLLWVKGKWPSAAKHFSFFPELEKMTERRWTACQVLQTLGPAGRPAAPEIIKILKSNDFRDLNAASMALWAIGIDADLCNQLDAVLEEGAPEHARAQIVGALRKVKPPSVRTLNALTAALTDPSPYVQYGAAETLGHLGVTSPAVASALRHLQSTSTNELVVVTSSAALWDLEKDADLVLARVFQVLENQLSNPLVRFHGSGGQGVTAGDQVFMSAGDLFRRMDLGEPEKSRALALLQSWSAKSGRIFIRMLLLPAMMELSFPIEKGLEVCTTGLNQPEDYYRIQAARLLASISDKYPVDELGLDALIQDREVGVRVYAAKIHWQKKGQANVVVPVLIAALNRTKHQSYYYDIEILPAALAALSDIGSEAHQAIVDLEAIARDPNPAIAKLASEALVKIRK